LVSKTYLTIEPDSYVQEMQEGVPKRSQRFRRKVREFDAGSLKFWTDSRSDEYCPHCDNHYVLDAVTPKAALKWESEDTRVDARSVVL
jgi:hypothetical protein